MNRIFFVITAFFILCSFPAVVIAADGTYTQTVSGGDWSNGANWSGGVVANGSGSTANFNTLNLTASNTVHLDNGGVTRTIGSLIFGDTTPSNHSWTIDDDGNASNTLTLEGGTLTITVNNLGAGSATISTVVTGSGDITKDGAGTLSLGSAVDISGNFTLSAGTLNAPVADFAVSGDWTKSGGTFNAGSTNNCKVVLDGAGTQKLTSGGTSFFDFKHSGAGTVVLQDAFTLSRNLTNDGGTFDCNNQNVVIKDFNNTSGTFIAPTSATFSISGACNLASGTFIPGTGKVVLNEGGTQDLTLGGATFFDLEHTGAGTVVLHDAFTVSRNLTNNGGTFNCNNQNVVIKDFNNTSGTFIAPTSSTFSISGGCNLTNGTFTPGTGTVTFNGSGDLTTASKNFNNVAITGSVDLHPDPLIITGTLNLSGAANLNTNSYAVTVTGLTTIQAGTYTAGAGGHAFNGGLTLTGGTINGAGTITGATTFDMRSGTVSAILAGNVGLTKTTTGTVTLSGANTYTGTTTVTTGTLQVGNATALGTGAGNIVNNATLDIGSTKLNIGAGNYTQGAGATLKAAISGTSSGTITTTGNCTVNAGDNLVLDVTNYIPNNTTYTIIDGTGAGAIVAPTISTNSAIVTFTATTVGKDLILTASRTANGYSTRSSNSNASAAGAALELAGNTGATGDMATVLNAMDNLSTSQIQTSLNSIVPLVDAGTVSASTEALNSFVGVAMDRVETMMLASNKADSAKTGMSAGDEEEKKLNGVWGKGYGSYLTQDMRQGVQGYDAWTAGTTIGIDRRFLDSIIIGASGGWGLGKVDSDANNAKTDMNSAQGSIYGGYQNDKYPFFIDASGSFAWNWYNGKRDLNVGPTINRTANADYDGQQYGAYIGGGYMFEIGKNLQVTPLLSLQYSRLHLAAYTETEAGALSLTLASQDYNFLQSGVGARLAYPIKCKVMTITPELHGKWLYDFMGDTVQVTSAFTGGGASFGSTGFSPAKSSFNIGTKLLLDTKWDVSLVGQYDMEIKEDFFGQYGAVTLRYSF